MRVFSKKNLEFSNPGSGEKVRLRTMEFANLPEWAAKDPLFLWAKAEGSLEVMGEDKPAVKSKSQVKRETVQKETALEKEREPEQQKSQEPDKQDGAEQ